MSVSRFCGSFLVFQANIGKIPHLLIIKTTAKREHSGNKLTELQAAMMSSLKIVEVKACEHVN
jgi:hypothetical protein